MGAVPEVPDRMLVPSDWVRAIIGAWDREEAIRMLEGRVLLWGLTRCSRRGVCHGKQVLSLSDNLSDVLALSVAGQSTGRFVRKPARQQPYSWLPKSSGVYGMSELGGTSPTTIQELLTAVNWCAVRHFTAPAVPFEKLWSRRLAEYYAWRRTCHHRVPDAFLCWLTWSPRHGCLACV